MRERLSREFNDLLLQFVRAVLICELYLLKVICAKPNIFATASSYPACHLYSLNISSLCLLIHAISSTILTGISIIGKTASFEDTSSEILIVLVFLMRLKNSQHNLEPFALLNMLSKNMALLEKLIFRHP